MDEPSNISILHAPKKHPTCDDWGQLSYYYVTIFLACWLTDIRLKMTMQQMFTGILTVFFGERVLRNPSFQTHRAYSCKNEKHKFLSGSMEVMVNMATSTPIP